MNSNSHSAFVRPKQKITSMFPVAHPKTALGNALKKKILDFLVHQYKDSKCNLLSIQHEEIHLKTMQYAGAYPFSYLFSVFCK